MARSHKRKRRIPEYPWEATVVSMNSDFERPGDHLLLRYIRETYNPDLLLRQEAQRGQGGVRVRGSNQTRVRTKKLIKLGSVGGHRAIRTGKIRLGNKNVLVVSAHGLHRGTVGDSANLRQLKKLGRRLKRRNRLGRRWIVGLDGNRGHKEVGQILGGYAVGHKVDGIITSPGLSQTLVTVDHTPIHRGWSNHPIIVSRVYLSG